MNMLRRVEKTLVAVKSLGKRSSEEYASLVDKVRIGKELEMEHGKRSRSGKDSVPEDVPKGYMAIYVGTQHRRFVIITKYLNHQLFKELLQKSEEEFGYEQQGGLTIACEPEFFEHLLWLIDTHSPTLASTKLRELLNSRAS